MRIAFHLGVHCTDDERLLRTLRRNADTLAGLGTSVPDPARYRSLIRESANEFERSSGSGSVDFDLLFQALGDPGMKRAVLSWDNFMAFAAWALRGRFYRGGGDRMRVVTGLFPDCQPEFFIALRNPASFLPELHRRQRGRDFTDLTEGTDPASLLWSDLIIDLLERNPGVPVTVWPDEDTPLIWPEILRAVAGVPPDTVIEGEEDLVASLMTGDGLPAMAEYFETNPPASLAAQREVIARFLEEYGRPELLEYTLNIPGWSGEFTDLLTETYERDLETIALLPGVRMLTA